MIKEKLLEAILDRCNAIYSSCNSHHITFNLGTLRGLVWAYLGEDPGAGFHSAGDVARALGVEFDIVDDKVVIKQPATADSPAASPAAPHQPPSSSSCP